MKALQDMKTRAERIERDIKDIDIKIAVLQREREVLDERKWELIDFYNAVTNELDESKAD